MKKSLFEISKMDCPSEERLIRMALAKYPDLNMQFDLEKRQVTIIHDQQTSALSDDLARLNLGSKLLSEGLTNETGPSSTKDESSVLRILLAINFTMFVLEIGLGLYAQSTGLIADSVDMFADAIVYGLSLYAVGKSIQLQHRAANLSGWFQMGLAIFAFAEVARRFYFGSEPNSILMMGVSVVALIANVSCLVLLMKHRNGAVHMKASWIFSTNDVLANVGVIIAGLLVFYFQSPVPDLIVGLIIAALVTRGAISILRLSKSPGPIKLD